MRKRPPSNLRVRSGIDANGHALLSDAEAGTPHYVCNGAPGAGSGGAGGAAGSGGSVSVAGAPDETGSAGDDSGGAAG